MKMKLIIQSKSSSTNLGNTSTEDREKCESARYFYLSFYLAHGGTKKKNSLGYTWHLTILSR